MRGVLRGTDAGAEGVCGWTEHICSVSDRMCRSMHVQVQASAGAYGRQGAG